MLLWRTQKNIYFWLLGKWWFNLNFVVHRLINMSLLWYRCMAYFVGGVFSKDVCFGKIRVLFMR